jgi:hypothetical protein
MRILHPERVTGRSDVQTFRRADKIAASKNSGEVQSAGVFHAGFAGVAALDAPDAE